MDHTLVVRTYQNCGIVWSRQEEMEKGILHSPASPGKLGSEKDSVQRLCPAKLMWSEQIPVAKEIPSYRRHMMVADTSLEMVLKQEDLCNHLYV